MKQSTESPAASKDLLLTSEEIKLIVTLEQFIQDQSTEYLNVLHVLHRKNQDLQDMLELSSDPLSFLDKIFLRKDTESKEDYQSRVLTQFAILQGLKLCPISPEFLKTIHTEIENIFTHQTIAEEDLYSHLYLKLEEIIQGTRFAIDEAKVMQIQTEVEQLALEQMVLSEDHARIKAKIEEFASTIGINIEIDAEFNLIKLHRSKRSDAPLLRYSVVSFKDGGKKADIALYPGKDGKLLGQGAFGRVKLGQELDSGLWRAIKIIQKDTLIEDENKILKKMNRFWGEQSRKDSKHYTAQTLISGMNLEKYINQSRHINPMIYPIIAEQVLLAVIHFHEQGLLHRDIKPGNFIWDESKQVLELCDFGMSAFLEAGLTGVRALSGSGTKEFMAPEINEDLHPGFVYYTFKTEAYAVGKTLENLFRGIDDCPHFYHEIVAGLTHPDPAERMDLNTALKLLEAQKGLASSIK